MSLKDITKGKLTTAEADELELLCKEYNLTYKSNLLRSLELICKSGLVFKNIDGFVKDRDVLYTMHLNTWYGSDSRAQATALQKLCNLIFEDAKSTALDTGNNSEVIIQSQLKDLEDK